MPLETPDKHHCDAALGYCELGMFEEANAELEEIDPFNRATPEVLAVRVVIYQGLKKWDALLVVASRLAECEPSNVQWTVSLAYATRRVISIQAAREHLVGNGSGLPQRSNNSIQPGVLFLPARKSGNGYGLRAPAFELEPAWRLTALEEADLEPCEIRCD